MSISKEIWINTSELAKLKNVSVRTVQRYGKAAEEKKNSYKVRIVKGVRSLQYEFLLTTLEKEIQEKYIHNNTIGTFTLQDKGLKSNSSDFKPPVSFSNVVTLNLQNKIVIPEKAKLKARLRLDLLMAWETFRNKSNTTNKEADKLFLEAYNTGLPYPELFEGLKKVSLPTLYRWKKDYENGGNYKALIPSYNYASVFEKQTKLSELERKYFLDLLLRPNKISVGNAVRLIKFILERGGISDICSYSTYKRYADWYKKNHYDVWILMREGQKALKDKVAPYIMRNPELLEVGDVLVADGHTLDFEVLNPFTGKPCRATLVAYLDWKSWDIASYELMLSENTQCIASALRNSILRLGKTPKICYQDNGRAFKSRFFRGTKNLDECGFYGLFGNLGIVPVFAKPYNAPAKVIERFFREFSETGERLMPSYTGNSPVNKPAWRMRNEKFHKKIHNDFVPTMQQAIQYIEQWLEFHRAQPCPNVPDKTVGEVFNEGTGTGVDSLDLDDLMLAQESRKIGRNGIKFLNNYYYDERLYGLKDSAVIKYSLFDLTSIKVYAKTGEFIAKAYTKIKVHPMAKYLGDNKDIYNLKRALKEQKRTEQKTIKKAVGFNGRIQNVVDWQEEIKYIEQKPEPSQEPDYKFICDYFPETENTENLYDFLDD